MELSNHDSIAILAFPETPEYPRLTRAALGELREQFRALGPARCFEGVVIASNSRSFATGAALEEVAALSGLEAFEYARTAQALFTEIEQSPLPVVAAIRGFCLGGGLDLALACHARVAAFDAGFGCPGATLGLMTGWGGTQRLPRLVGRAAALQMMATAERVPAAQAMALGLVDELSPPADLIPAAARWAKKQSCARREGSREFGVWAGERNQNASYGWRLANGE